MTSRNLQVVLKNQRDGLPAVEDFTLTEGAMPQAAAGQVLVRNIYLSLDPFLRKAIRGDHHGYSILAPGDVIYGVNVARVVESRVPDYAVGDLIVADTGWREYAAIDAAKIGARFDPALGPLTSAIGALGSPGLTAWASVAHLIQPALGSTFVVSAAAGPVGAVAGQLAKRAGARVVGIAGSAEKCEVVTGEYGFDACVNYKIADWEQRLDAACPNGIDGYHDNVGGAMLEAMAKHLNSYATVALCGRPGDYSGPGFTPVPLAPFVRKRARLKGLVVYDYKHDQPRYLRMAAPLVRTGQLKVKEDTVTGLDQAPAHFVKLMRGDNIGKAIVVVGPERG